MDNVRVSNGLPRFFQIDRNFGMFVSVTLIRSIRHPYPPPFPVLHKKNEIVWPAVHLHFKPLLMQILYQRTQDIGDGFRYLGLACA